MTRNVLHEQLIQHARCGRTLQQLTDLCRSNDISAGLRDIRSELKRLIELGDIVALGKNHKVYFTAGEELKQHIRQYLKRFSILIEEALKESGRWMTMREIRSQLSTDLASIGECAPDSGIIQLALEQLGDTIEIVERKSQKSARYAMTLPVIPNELDLETVGVSAEEAWDIQEAVQEAFVRRGERFAWADLKAVAYYLNLELPEREVTLNYIVQSGLCVRVLNTLLPMFEEGPKLYSKLYGAEVTIEDISAATQTPDEMDWRIKKPNPSEKKISTTLDEAVIAKNIEAQLFVPRTQQAPRPHTPNHTPVAVSAPAAPSKPETAPEQVTATETAITESPAKRYPHWTHLRLRQLSHHLSAHAQRPSISVGRTRTPSLRLSERRSGAPLVLPHPAPQAGPQKMRRHHPPTAHQRPTTRRPHAARAAPVLPPHESSPKSREGPD